MQNIKNELINLIDNNEIAEFFAKVDELRLSDIVEVKNLQPLNQLRQEFISGTIKFDYFSRLKAWISISIIIVVNPSNKGDEVSACDKVQNFIANGKIDKAVETLLVLSKNTDSYNTVILLSGQYRDLERNKNMGIIDTSSAGIQLARITNALLSLLREL